MLRFKHPALADLRDKYCHTRAPLDRQRLLLYLKTRVDDLCNETCNNWGASDLSQVVRELRLETESRRVTEADLEQNQQEVKRAFEECLHLAQELMQKHRLPLKNNHDTQACYLLYSRVIAEAAQHRRQANEAALAACPDEDHVSQRRQAIKELKARVAALNARRRELLTRRQEVEAHVDPHLVQGVRAAWQELQEREWAMAQLQRRCD